MVGHGWLLDLKQRGEKGKYIQEFKKKKRSFEKIKLKKIEIQNL